VSTEIPEPAGFSPPELDVLVNGMSSLPWLIGRDMARERAEADPGPGDGAPVFTRARLAQAWSIDV
jgi:hypothetical protein